MGGIAGLYHFNGAKEVRADLGKMTSLIKHRGRDEIRIWGKSQIGLGQLLTHFTTESEYETLPITSQCGNITLVGDIRIDNRAELIGLLALKPANGRPIADGTILLSAYEKWGKQCVEKIVGVFSVAIWDERERALFCARDPMGVRPFFYHINSEKKFVFGSEVKAVLAIDDVPRELDDVRVAYFLAGEGDDAERTFYKNIQSLPPAHCMQVKADGSIQLKRYWSLDPEYELRLGSDEEYAEGFLEIFEQAVKSRLRTNAEPGIMLSGGLDSSSVTGVARNTLQGAQKQPLQTFSAIFPDLPKSDFEKADESEFVQALVDQGGIKSHALSFSDVSPLVDMDKALWHLDAPYLACNNYVVLSIYKYALSQGVNAVLDGGEGDVVVSHGLSYLGELAFGGQWNVFADEALALINRAGINASGWYRYNGMKYLTYHAKKNAWGQFYKGMQVGHSQFNMPLPFLLWRAGIKPSLIQLGQKTGLRESRKKVKKQPVLMSADLAKRTSFRSRMEELNALYKANLFTAREAHWQYLQVGGGSISASLTETNHMAAMVGVEERHPFYDSRLVKYCLSLPPDQKLHDGWTRLVLRRAMKGILPEKLRWRKTKSDLSPNFHRNFDKFERKEVKNQLQHNENLLSAYLNIDEVRKLYDGKDLNMLWQAFMLLRWLRHEMNINT